MPHPVPPADLRFTTRPPAVILAGGLSRRMGGGDKAQRPLGGVPMLAHVIGVMRPQVGALALNANGPADLWAAFGLTVLPDRLPESLPDRPGPLAGLLAAMDWAAGLGTTEVVVVPSDTPFLPADLVARLTAAARDAPHHAAMAASRDAATGQRRAHPTCGLWPVAARDRLRQGLLDGMRRLSDWSTALQAVEIVFAPAPDGPEGRDPFFNVNTPEDAALAERMLGRGRAV